MVRSSSNIALAVILALAASPLVTACTSNLFASSTKVDAGLACVDDSPRCLSRRRVALNQIMGDSSGKWIERPPSASSDASGVRLFAFKQRKRQLTCTQLATGYVEASGARNRLRASNDPRLTPALISRGAILGDEVAKELKREMKRRRCKAAA
ncbi:MAG: hypothetical protein ACR2PA_04345 [Hyphomicrobiaceae bacterium]